MIPNVLLVVFDTARADATEPYGAPRGATPTLSQLADQGLSVESVFATANWTLPSHASMFTGLLPGPLGLRPTATGHGGVAETWREALEVHRRRLLPEVFREAGFSTAAVSANPWISGRHGFDQGFEEFVTVAGRPHVPGRGLRGRARWTRDAVHARVDDGMARAEDVLTRWSEHLDGRPFFWFVNLMECHSPYLPPRPYNDLPLLDRFRAGEDARRFQTHDGFARASVGELPVPARSVARMRHLYDRSVLAMDDWLARVLERLAQIGRLADTLVIVTSDHGENFGEGGLFGHTLSLDDRLLRVPLVMAGPRIPTVGASVVSLADMPRLLAEAIDLKDHPWSEPACREGYAVAQHEWAGLASQETIDRLTGLWRVPAHLADRLATPMSCVTDGRRKLVRMGAEQRLHDVLEDPMETTDVSAAHPDVVSRMESVLDAVAPSSAMPSADADVADDTTDLEDRLRLLGYL